MDDMVLGQLLLQEGVCSQEQLRELYKAIALKPGSTLEQIAFETGILSQQKYKELEEIEQTQQTVRVPPRKSEKPLAKGADLPPPPPPPLPPPSPKPMPSPAAKLTPEEIALATEQTLVAKPKKAAASGMRPKVTASVPDQLPADVQEMINNPDYVFDKFVLVGLLGKGGMGEVWKAWQKDLKRYVAIKFLEAEGGIDLDRFFREAQTASSLSHPNITALYELNRFEGKYYIVMEYVDGQTLQDLLAKLPMERALKVGRDAALALDHAHKTGVIHRDIKPQNIMVAKSGRTYVMDFGLAKQTRGDGTSSNTVAGMILGTPAFMSPEQAEGKFQAMDRRSDIYSLGATLYALITGEQPVTGRAVMDTLYKVVHGEITPPRKVNPDVPAAVEAIILKSMAKLPSHRYQNARDFAEDIKRWLDGDTPIAVGGHREHAKTANIRPAPKKSSPGLVIGVLIGFIALVVVVLVVFVMRKNNAEEPGGDPGKKGSKTDEPPKRTEEIKPHVDTARRALEDAGRVLSTENASWSRLVDASNDAIAAAKKALAIDANHAEASFITGKAFFLKRDFEAAQAPLRKAADSGFDAAYDALGRLYLVWGDSLDDIANGSGTRRGPAGNEKRKLAAAALRKFAAAAKTSSDDKTVAEALIALAENDYARMITAGEKAAKLADRWEGHLVRGLGRSSTHPADRAGAREDGIEAVRRRKSDPFLLEVAAYLCIDNRKTEDGRRYADDVIRLLPDYARAYVWRAYASCQMKPKDTAGALKDAEKAIGLAPDRLGGRQARVYCYLLSEPPRLDEAFVDVTFILGKAPDLPDALNTRGYLYMKRNETANALADFDKAIENEPHVGTYYYNRAQAHLALQNVDKMIANIEKAAECEAIYLVTLADCYVFDKPDADKAVAAITKALEKYPNDHNTLYIASRAYLLARKNDLALKYADESLRVLPNCAKCTECRGLALSELGRYREALADYDRLVKAKPDEGAYWTTRGSILAGLGRYKEAIENVKKGIGLKPDLESLYTKQLEEWAQKAKDEK